MPRPCRPPIRFASRNIATVPSKRLPFSPTGMPSSKVTETSSASMSTPGSQNFTP